MKQYKTVNNLVGWITFLIAANRLLHDDRAHSQFLGLPGIHHHRL